MIDQRPGPLPSPAGVAQRVEALLQRQHDLLVRLDALSTRQMAYVEGDEPERLLEVIAERQGVVDALQALSAELEPLRPAWHDASPLLQAGQQQALRNRIEAIAGLLDAITARDAVARRILAERRDGIAADLLNLDKGRGAVAAYAGAPTGSPALHDQEA